MLFFYLLKLKKNNFRFFSNRIRLAVIWWSAMVVQVTRREQKDILRASEPGSGDGAYSIRGELARPQHRLLRVNQPHVRHPSTAESASFTKGTLGSSGQIHQRPREPYSRRDQTGERRGDARVAVDRSQAFDRAQLAATFHLALQ